jgi:hypothetical protein
MTEPIKPTPDEIVASVADDPDVVAALRRWDPATPSSYRDLGEARRAGAGGHPGSRKSADLQRRGGIGLDGPNYENGSWRRGGRARVLAA